MHEPEELPGEAAHLRDDRLDLAEGLHEPRVIRMFGFVDRYLAPSHEDPGRTGHMLGEWGTPQRPIKAPGGASHKVRKTLFCF